MTYVKKVKHLFSFEVALILFLFAGQYKTSPTFDFVPVDITALTFGVSVLAGGWVLFKRRIALRKSDLVLSVLFGMFVCYGLLSLAWTPSSNYAQEKGFFLATLTVWPFVAFTHVIGPKPRRVRRFMVALLLFSGWIATVVLLVYLSEAVRAGQQISAFGRKAGYIGLGRIVGVGALVALMFALRLARSRLLRWLSAGTFGLYMFLLLVIGSRASFIATVIPTLFPLVAGIRWRRFGVIAYERYIIPFVLFLGSGIVAGGLLFQNKTFSTLARLAYLIRTGGEDQARFQLYEQALDIWAANPFFGIGLAGWPIAAGYGDYLMYPHNLILEIMAELGAVGLGLFAIFAGYALLVFWKRHDVQATPMALLVLMLLANTFLNAMSTGDLPHNRIVFGMIGLLLFHSGSGTGEEPQPSPAGETSTSSPPPG
jgi:O-antigen ligase